MKDGYPEEGELKLIERWNPREFMALIEYIQERWTYPNMFNKKWTNSSGQWTLELELITGGWSGNEDIIKALLKNLMFSYWYSEWKRGGYHKFEINPCQVGYIRTSEYCRQKGAYKQYIYSPAGKRKFDWIIVSENIRFIKPKKKEAK